MFPVIQLFAKAPVPGRVKTRLQPVVSAVDAASLHRSFVADVLEGLEGFTGVADVELHVDVLTEDWPEFGVPRVLQYSGDLGERMRRAALGALEAGRPGVVILGSDSPGLPGEFVRELIESERDVTFGPSEDGGYWGIATRRVAEGMFDGVEWSTERALEQSVAACERCGLTVGLGREWFDVDSPADLVRLVREPMPPRTTVWLREHQFLV